MIKRCKNCGKNDFYIHEILTHTGQVDPETGKLEASSNIANEIDKIECLHCGTEYGVEDFEDVEFNY